MAEAPLLIAHRSSRQAAAVLFVHGFSRDSRDTRGDFPKFLAEEPRLNGWDIFSLGYHTRLRVDIEGLWSADPPLDSLAGLLRTATANEPLSQYKGSCDYRPQHGWTGSAACDFRRHPAGEA
jgi:hypothetical protein